MPSRARRRRRPPFRRARGLLALGATFLVVAVASSGAAPRLLRVRVEKSVLVPMRDGVRLSTDLYFPVGASEPLPVVLMRMPYGKNNYMRLREPGSVAHRFVEQGYVVAAQDMRGRFESEGEYVVSRADREDGYDTVDWLSRQPWSSGKVGTYGCSYLGENQIQLAATRHPSHVAAIAQAAAGGYHGTYRGFLFMDGGAFEMASGLSWFSRAGVKNFNRPSSELSDEEYRRRVQQMETYPEGVPRVPLKEAFWHLPTIEILDHYGVGPTDYADFVSHIPGDPYWESLNYVTDADRFDVPTLHVNSWFDLGANETLLLFNLFQDNAVSDRARDNQFVIMSPTTHCASESASEHTIVGERDFGDARLDYRRIYLDWFDRWLKGVDNGILEMPHVRYYLMGANEWRHADRWPLPATRFTPWYLHSGGGANTRQGDGALGPEPPGAEPADELIYDPADPVPSVGGPICCISADDAAAGAYDQSEVEMRPDVLVYSSAPLRDGIEVSGPLSAILYVSSSAPDTDFTVKLADVLPDGRAFNVQEGILRARYREGFDRVALMEEGEVYELGIDLHATAHYFAPGHRIRVEISSSNFPRFDRNLNTGGNNWDESEWQVARNRVHHSSAYPSHLVLPIVGGDTAAPAETR